MSDDEGKKDTVYRLEYASSGRAKCKDEYHPLFFYQDSLNRLQYTMITTQALQCVIPKGSLRLGTQVDFRGNTTFVWRHWGCVTPQILANFKKSSDSAEDIDGFEELKAVDKDRVRKAWEEGKVAEEDIPDSAKKGSGDEDEEEEKPKKKRAPAKKKAKKDEDDEDDEDEDEKPKKKAAKKAPAKKAVPKKKVAKKKKDSDSEGENFGEEIDKVSDDDDDVETGKKRKKAPTSKKAKKPAAKKSKKKAASDDEDED